MKEWKTYKLGDLINIQSGGTPNKAISAYWGGGIPWISAKTMYVDFITDSDLHITEEGLKNGSKLAPIGSILLLTRGSGLFNRIPVCLVKEPVAYNQDIKCITVKDGSITSNAFMFFWLYSQKELLSGILETTGIGAGKIDTCRLLDINVLLPDIETQSKFIQFCSSILEKIEVNKQINDNLEQQAQNIFNHYFIDNPIELGSYSEGVLTDIAVYLNGLAMQKFRPEGSDFGLPVLKIKELGQRSCDNNSDRCSSLIKEEYIVNDGDVIFSWSGTLLVDLWCGGKCGLNQHLFKVTSDTYPKWFYYFWTKHHLDNFIRVAKDKAVTMGHIKRTELEKANIIVPTQDKLSEINRIISPIITKIINHRVEMRKLAQLRDSLLPQLMSGELKINEIDC